MTDRTRATPKLDTVKGLMIAMGAWLVLATSAWSASVDKGKEAFRNSDYAAAWQEWKPLAEQGDAEAQVGVGLLYQLGYGLAQDDTKAMEWYTHAAQQGNANAQTNLAVLYESGRGAPKNLIEAANWYAKAAHHGQARAQNNLGKMYADGRGVPQDDAEAVKWYRKAAEQGYAQAQSNLGWMLGRGLGVQKNLIRAAYWLTQASGQGDVWAQTTLGNMYAYGEGVPQNDTEAAKWYTKAAQQGDASAQNSLAKMYENGLGISKDEAEAVKWYTKAARQGVAGAAYRLGEIYQDGKIVEQDGTEAVDWYRRAAEQGLAAAQFRLGEIYQRGRIVAEDDTEAFNWFRKAAEQDLAVAQFRLGVLYEQGVGVPADDDLAMQWYARAAQQGNILAQYNLGGIYREKGTIQDLAKAVMWYSKSVEGGFPDTLGKIEGILKQTRQSTVGVAVAHVREEPATSSPVVFQLDSGDSVHLFDSDSAWHQIYDAERGKLGWVHQSTLSAAASNASSGGVELFGVPLTTATRRTMRNTLAVTDVEVIREDNDYWVDTYNPASELTGADQLYTAYTNAGGLAYAQYRFPSRMDKDQVTQIAEMVATKYDSWDTVVGNPGLGDVEYQWSMDGVTIRVFRGWPNTTTFLKYEIPGNLKTMRTEIEASKKSKKEREAQSQTNAF